MGWPYKDLLPACLDLPRTPGHSLWHLPPLAANPVSSLPTLRLFIVGT